VPGAPIATARQTDNQIDLFFIDGNGVVNVMWVVDVGVWQGPVGLTASGAAPGGAPIVAAPQTSNQIDIFFHRRQRRRECDVGGRRRQLARTGRDLAPLTF
jgi:hypothetical protein